MQDLPLYIYIYIYVYIDVYIYIYIMIYNITIMKVYYHQMQIFLKHRTNSVSEKRVSFCSVNPFPANVENMVSF